MRKENADFNTKFISEAGSYLINSDYFAFVELKDYACYVIADGIDPDEKKESAKLAVTTVITEFSDSPGMSAGKLKHFLKAAHEALLRESDEIRLEASIVIMITDYKKAIWGHAGNSRLCWIKNGEIKLVTKDTSLTQRMVDQEEVPIDQIAAHEERNNLYTYLGQPGRFTPVISAKRKLEDGDIFILMTRGVWENVGDAELIDAVDGVSKAEDVCTGLEDVILSQRLEVVENYTIASVFINKIYKNPKAGRNKKILKIAFTVFFAIAMIVVSLLVVRYNQNKSKLKKIETQRERGVEYLQEMNYSSASKPFTDALEIADKISAGKKSAAYRKVEAIKHYNKMVEYVNIGLASLNEGEYKKAKAQFDNAADHMNTLKEECGEDISSFEEGIKAYQKYADNMYQGEENISAGKYEEADKNYQAAFDLMEDINDTNRRDTAKALKEIVSAKNCIVRGNVYREDGDQKAEQGDYKGAIAAYESAQEQYKKAQDRKDPDAEELLMDIESRIDYVKRQYNTRSDSERIAEADASEALGDEALKKGNKAEAAKAYQDAYDSLSQVSDADVSSKMAELKEKIANVSEDAEAELMSAIEFLSRQDYAGAIRSLTKAKDIYTILGNTANAKKMDSYIRNVESLQSQATQNQ